MSKSEDSNIRAKVCLEPEQVDALRNACYDDIFASYLQLRNDAIIALLYDVRNRLRHRSLQTTERVYDHFKKV